MDDGSASRRWLLSKNVPNDVVTYEYKELERSPESVDVPHGLSSSCRTIRIQNPLTVAVGSQEIFLHARTSLTIKGGMGGMSTGIPRMSWFEKWYWR